LPRVGLVGVVVLFATMQTALGGVILVSDDATDSIIRIDKYGHKAVFATAGLSLPEHIAFDSAGNVYVASQGNDIIHEFSSTGRDLGVFASTGLSQPTGLAFDARGDLYVSNNDGNQASPYKDIIRVFSSRKRELGGLSARVYGPESLAFGHEGNLFVANDARTITRITPSGRSRISSNTGALESLGLAVDVIGDVHDTSLYNTVRWWTPDGTFQGDLVTGRPGLTSIRATTRSSDTKRTDNTWAWLCRESRDPVIWL
jgi:hypothetical protein